MSIHRSPLRVWPAIILLVLIMAVVSGATLTTQAMQPAQEKEFQPPDACGVPLYGTFGQDLEVMTAPWEAGDAFRHDLSAELQVPILTESLNADSRVDMVTHGLDHAVAVFIRDGEVFSMEWWRQDNLWRRPERLSSRSDFVAVGNPAVISSREGHWAVFVRTDSQMIKMRQSERNNLSEWSNTWQQLGEVWAASDPVPVSKDPSHMAVFFVDADDKVRGTDQIMGQWREVPYTLGDRTFEPAFNIVSPHKNRMAIFAIGQDNALYVREWTNVHRPDWADTGGWRKLKDGVLDSRPAVVTRHASHMAVAVMEPDTAVTVFDWSQKRAQDEDPGNDWQATSLGGYNNSSLFAYTTDSDAMVVGVTNTSNEAHYRAWDEESGWTGWSPIGPPMGAGLRNLSVVAPSPDEYLMLSSTGHGFHQTFKSFSTTKTYHTMARPGANVLARSQGNVYWITAPYTNGERWWLGSRGTTEVEYLDWTWLNHWGPDHIGQISMAAGDLTQDGNDEVVVSSSNGGWLDLSVVTVGGAGQLNVEQKYVKKWDHINQDVNVAVGDVDGDGQRNEIVIATRRLSHHAPNIYLFVYRYENGAITPVLEDYGIDQSYDGFLTDISLTVVGDPAQQGDQIFLQDQVLLGLAPLSGVRRISVEYDVQARGWSVDTSEPAPAFHREETAGERTTALASGDINMDGRPDLIAANAGQLTALLLEADGTIMPIPAPELDGARSVSLAVGDLNRDGRDEVVASMAGATQAFYYGDFLWKSLALDQQWGDVLIGDLDGDSDVAQLYGCEPRRDVNVVAVINAAPRYYDGGTPLQGSEAQYGRSKSVSNASSSLVRGIYGTSVTVGMEVELDAPLLGIKLGSLRNDVTAEFVGSNFAQNETSRSVAEGSGHTFTEALADSSGSAVIYREVKYNCYYYWLYKPESPDQKNKMSVCNVASQPTQVASTIEEWNSTIKNEAGSSWTEVKGRENNDIDVQDYSRASFEEIEPSRLVWEMDGTLDITSGGFENTWSMEDTTAEVTTTGGSIEGTITGSTEAVAGPVVAGFSVTYGAGGEWSHSTEWSSGLNFGGSVDYFPGCGGCTDYGVVPYVYWETARRADGQSYQYLVQDYYLDYKSASVLSAPNAAATAVTAGPLPQAPLVNSPSHPDASEWYTGNDLTFTWEQPAGDTAVISGYSWQLSREASIDHTSLVSNMTATTAYDDVEDGLYYFHIQAVNEEGERGPMATRAVRIDSTAPRPEFVLNPAAPSGFDDWYKSAVTVTVEAADSFEPDAQTVGTVGTVETVETVEGSGVTAIEMSSDGVQWQPYSSQIFDSNTMSTTLWARAMDAAGNISAPISTTIKVDLNPPTSLDADGAGLSYTAIAEDDEQGNAQLVLGGVLEDDFSGRGTFEIRSSSHASWQAADLVGEFPMPQDNIFTSTVTTLNWVYTPTFKLRGDYPLYGRAIDAAGNAEAEYELGSFTWFPEANPDLSESQVSIHPAQAAVGDEVEVTIGVRNIGYQESKVAITNTVPAALSIMPETVTDAGVVDGNQITWTLHDGVWPGETHYLTFRATVESGEGPVANTVTLQPYWEGLDAGWVVDEYGDQFILPALTSSATLTIGSASAAESVDEQAELLAAWVDAGQITTARDVTIALDATLAAEHLQVVEWKWDGESSAWVEVQDSGLLPLSNSTPALTVTEGTGHLHATLDWQLSAGDGVKYLGIYLGDAQQRLTHLNDDNLIRVNLMDAGGQEVSAGERVQYRLKLNPHELSTLAMQVESGDARLTVWEPRNGFYPDYVAQETTGLVSLSLQAVEAGLYLVEVEGLSSGTSYTLQEHITSEEAQAAQSSRAANTDAGNEHPLTLSTPHSLLVGGSPDDGESHIHLPLIWRSAN